MTPSAGKDVETQEFSFTAGANANGTATSEDNWWFLTKLSIFLQYASAVVFLCIYSNALKTIQKKKCTQMFRAVFFISTQT